MGIKVGQVDVTASPGLSGRFMVTALPTIFQYDFVLTPIKLVIIIFLLVSSTANLDNIKVPGIKSPLCRS